MKLDFAGWHLKLRTWARDILALWFGLRDPRVSLPAKIISLFPVLYLLMPLDIIPDIFPVIGWLDDVAMLPLAAAIVRRLVPPDVFAQLRHQAELRLLRYTPFLRYGLPACIIVWMLLAALSGALFISSFRREQAQMMTLPDRPIPIYQYLLDKEQQQ